MRLHSWAHIRPISELVNQLTDNVEEARAIEEQVAELLDTEGFETPQAKANFLDDLLWEMRSAPAAAAVQQLRLLLIQRLQGLDGLTLGDQARFLLAIAVYARDQAWPESSPREYALQALALAHQAQDATVVHRRIRHFLTTTPVQVKEEYL